MASFNLTIEDCSPLVTYAPAGAWEDSPSDDSFLQSYSNQNSHRSSAQGASASVDFHGSGITFFGGRRPGYGRFSLTVDGQTVVANGDASSPENRAQEILATVTGLSLGNHRAVFTKLDDAPVDVDSITVFDQLGPLGSEIRIDNFDDVSTALTYLPSTSAWQTNQRDIFQGGTLHFSEAPDAAVSMTFSGEAVAIYGTMSPDRTTTKVTLDGEEFILQGGHSGHASRLHTKVLLFFRNGLGSGQHQFTLAVESPTAEAPFMDLDAVAILSSTQNASGTLPNGASPTSTGLIGPSGSSGSSNGGSNTGGSAPPSGVSKAVIIGSAVGGAVGLIACIGLCILAFYWRRRRRRSLEDGGSRSPVSPDLPMQQDPKRLNGLTISGPLESSVFVFPPPEPPKPKPLIDKFRHSIAPSYYGSPESGRSRNSIGSTNASTSPLVKNRAPPLPPLPSLPSNPRLPLPASPRPLPKIPVPAPSQTNYYDDFAAASPSISERALRSSPRRVRQELSDYSQRRI